MVRVRFMHIFIVTLALLFSSTLFCSAPAEFSQYKRQAATKKYIFGIFLDDGQPSIYHFDEAKTMHVVLKNTRTEEVLHVQDVYKVEENGSIKWASSVWENRTKNSDKSMNDKRKAKLKRLLKKAYGKFFPHYDSTEYSRLKPDPQAFDNRFTWPLDWFKPADKLFEFNRTELPDEKK